MGSLPAVVIVCSLLSKIWVVLMEIPKCFHIRGNSVCYESNSVYVANCGLTLHKALFLWLLCVLVGQVHSLMASLNTSNVLFVRECNSLLLYCELILRKSSLF